MSGRPAPVEAVIFDAEGVIIDTEAVWDHAQTQLLAESGRVYDRDAVKPMLTGRSALEGAKVLKDRYRLDAPAEEIARRRAALVAGYLATEVAYVPGFEAFWAQVSTDRLTAVATSMDPPLFDLVDRRLGLRARFAGRIVTLAEVARSKPEPDLFLAAAALLGCRPDGCLVIEDSPYGIEAAARAGMRCVGLATTYPPDRLAGADQVVARFEDIDLEALTR